MLLTSRILLKTNSEISSLLDKTVCAYKKEVNRIAQFFIQNNSPRGISYKMISTEVPFRSKSEVINEARNIFYKYKKNQTLSYQQENKCIWTSNYQLTNEVLTIETGWKTGYKKVSIHYIADEHQKKLLENTTKKLKIKRYKKWWIAEFIVEVPEIALKNHHIEKMGVDLGIKVPAVAVTSNGKIRFFGNGRQARFKRNSFYSHVKKLQKEKKWNEIRSLKRKLKNYAVNQCHCVSRGIVEFAKENNVGVIKLESLKGIYHAGLGFNAHQINQWSYYRLIEMIKYKAELAGVRIAFVNSRDTSRTCPRCKQINAPKRRKYQCRHCGYTLHRDLVGAKNILQAPELK